MKKNRFIFVNPVFGNLRCVMFVLCFMLLAAEAYGQGFTGRTNEVYFNFKGESISSVLPKITWITPTEESSFSQQFQLTISASVYSDVPLKELKLVVKTGLEKRERAFPLESSSYQKDIALKLNLVDGENILELIAVNEKGASVSSQRSILVGKDNVALLSADRKDYALIFATDKYDHWSNLVNPISDARTIETILKEKYNFQVEVVENATFEEMSEKLTDYNERKFNVQDQLMVFFAGHGSFDEVLNEGAVVASNSLRNDKAKITYLSHPIIRNRLENIKCEHIFLVMDVCFGGTLDPVLTASRDTYAEASDSEYLVRTLSKRTRKYLTSGGKEYVSDGIAGKHSPFAGKFIQALREVGSGTDRILTLHELRTYFLKLPTETRSGGFGSDVKESDFVFVTKQ